MNRPTLGANVLRCSVESSVPVAMPLRGGGKWPSLGFALEAVTLYNVYNFICSTSIYFYLARK